MATYLAHLKDTRNNKTHIYERTIPDDYTDKDQLYMWTAGNFSCDCNRAIIMYDDWEMKCNSGDNVIILEKLENKTTGKVILETGQPTYFE